jgi:hypothetical protein
LIAPLDHHLPANDARGERALHEAAVASRLQR